MTKNILKIGPFKALLDHDLHQRFNEKLLDLLKNWDYQVVTVVIDKRAHRDQYSVWRNHPYHYCLKVLLERFVLFLNHGHHRGDAMVEGRGGREDRQLNESYGRLYNSGSENIKIELWQSCLTSKQLKVKPKSSNIPGLQLADLLAYPSRREIIKEKGLIHFDHETFSEEICAILRQNKYLRSGFSGEIWGYGKKLLP